jgi:hypothetical protein
VADWSPVDSVEWTQDQLSKVIEAVDAKAIKVSDGAADILMHVRKLLVTSTAYNDGSIEPRMLHDWFVAPVLEWGMLWYFREMAEGTEDEKRCADELRKRLKELSAEFGHVIE